MVLSKRPNATGPNISSPTDGEGIEGSSLCPHCNNLEGVLDKEVDVRTFLVSAETCSWCSIIFSALQKVTDITAPGFTRLKFTREKSIISGKNVLDIRCYREKAPHPDFPKRPIKDYLCRSCKIYTPLGADDKASIPNLGLRDDPDDNYRELQEDVDDRLKLAKAWLDKCTAEHSHCTPHPRSWPRRVLEIDGDKVYLQEHASRPTGAEYAALSYCWGPNATFKTLKSNYQTHLAGISTSDMPLTLRDAVKVCASMDIKYIWIDALCIIQDDRQDWMEQIPMMAHIYSDATLVIAALGSATVHDGCMQLTAKNAPFCRTEIVQDFGDGPRKVELSIQLSDSIYADVPAHRPMDYSERLTPLLNRAWTFQERYLAKRVLFCTPSELAWECIAFTACECHKTTTPTFPHLFHAFLGVGQLSTIVNQPPRQAAIDDELEQPMTTRRKVSIWTEAVRQYSQRMLTNWSDRLAGIHGVVVALTKAFPDVFKEEDYVFGMWKPHLILLMTWTTEYHGGEVPKTDFEDKVPSWSWAKVAALVEYKDIWDENTVAIAEIANLDVTMYNKHGFGAGSGVLTIHGFLIPTQGGRDWYQLYDIMVMEGIEDEIEVAFPLPDCFENDEVASIGGQLRMIPDNRWNADAWKSVTHFVPLTGKNEESSGYRIQGIFLEPVANKAATFRRVGLGYDYSGYVAFGDPEETTQYFAEFRLE